MAATWAEEKARELEAAWEERFVLNADDDARFNMRRNFLAAILPDIVAALEEARSGAADPDASPQPEVVTFREGTTKKGGMNPQPTDYRPAPPSAMRPLDVKEVEEDRLRDSIGRKAQACLDHVRNVTWGDGQVNYSTTDRGMRLTVNLRVVAIGKDPKE